MQTPHHRTAAHNRNTQSEAQRHKAPPASQTRERPDCGARRIITPQLHNLQEILCRICKLGNPTNEKKRSIIAKHHTLGTARHSRTPPPDPRTNTETREQYGREGTLARPDSSRASLEIQSKPYGRGKQEGRGRQKEKQARQITAIICPEHRGGRLSDSTISGTRIALWSSHSNRVLFLRWKWS